MHDHPPLTGVHTPVRGCTSESPSVDGTGTVQIPKRPSKLASRLRPTVPSVEVPASSARDQARSPETTLEGRRLLASILVGAFAGRSIEQGAGSTARQLVRLR